MFRISLVLVLASAAAAQTEISDGGSVTLESGVTIKLKTVMEPAMPRSKFVPLGTGFRSDGNTMRFILWDDVSASCFGVRVDVSAEENGGVRRVTFGPVGPEGAGMSVAFGDRPYKESPLPKYPPPQELRDGDTIALDLMVSADGKERVVEYLKFEFGGKTAGARDFTLDDGPAHFSFKPAGEVLVNGSKPSGNAVFIDGRQGHATVWVYLPVRGRYILSLLPHEGFVKAGVVRGSSLAFQADGKQLEVRLGSPLAGSQTPWNLYMLRDPHFVPPPGQEGRVIVSADRLEN